jgi:TRAP-type C4-dicarboxylate transport system permease small subunit
MRPLLRAIDAVNAAGAAVAAVACFALAVMLIVEVIATSFFAWSQPWAVEYAAYLLCATLFAGTGWTLRQGGHIRVTLLTQALPEGARRIADLVGTVFALGVASFMTWACAENAIRSFERGSVSYYPSRTPLVFPQSVLALGLLLLTLALLARAVRLALDEAPEVEAPGATPGEAAAEGAREGAAP